MNELIIFCEGGPWLYFKTKKTTAKDAFYEFEDICDRIGIDTSNLQVKELELQNKDFVRLDRIDW